MIKREQIAQPRGYRPLLWCWLLALVLGFFERPAVSFTSDEPSEAVHYFQKHEFEKAAACFHARLRDNPKDSEALIYLGRLAFENNRLSEAVRYFEKAVAATPNDGGAYHWLGRACGVQARDLGAPRGLGPARRAKRALELAVALGPTNIEARLDLATFYREAPALIGGSKRAAIEQAHEIKKRDAYAGALIQGDLATDDKEYAEAEREFRSAVILRPERAEAYFHLGLLYQRTRAFDKAFATFEKMLRVDPEDNRAWFQLGKTADLSGQHLDRGEEALKMYLQCRPFYIMPKLSWAHRRLGNIYLKRGQNDAAREEYLAALKADPADEEAATALKQVDKRANSAH